MALEQLSDILHEGSAHGTHRPAFAVKRQGTWRYLSYGDFRAKVDLVTGALAAAGVGLGDRVGIIGSNSPEWAAIALATTRLGAAYVPMYEAQHQDDWRHIFKDSGIKVVFVNGAKAAAFSRTMASELESLTTAVSLSGDQEGIPALETWLTGASPMSEAKDINIDPKTLAAIIYTSGTTGLPKGVMLSHGNLCSNLSSIAQVFPLSPNDRSLAFLPWAHSYGQVGELFYMLKNGACICIAESVDKLADNLVEMAPTVLFAVPSVFTKIRAGVLAKVEDSSPIKQRLFSMTMDTAETLAAQAKNGRPSPFTRLRYKALEKVVLSKIRARFGGQLLFASVGGAALNPDVARFVENLGIPVYPGYGLSETSPVVSTNYPGARRAGSAGKVIPGVTVKVDESVNDGEPGHGEIIVYGPNVMQGYLGMPEETARVLTEDGGFRTGDIGYVDNDGFLFITGRLKEQYKLENGKYVVPNPLEEKIKLSAFILNAFIWGEDMPYNVALIVPDFPALSRWANEEGLAFQDPTLLLSDAKVRAHFDDELRRYSQSFKSYERIRNFIFVPSDFTIENGMLTPSLKVRRKAVFAAHADAIRALY